MQNSTCIELENVQLKPLISPQPLIQEREEIRDALKELEETLLPVTQMKSTVIARLQAVDLEKAKALDVMSKLRYLQNFSKAQDPSDLPAIFQEQQKFLEAAALTAKLLAVTKSVEQEAFSLGKATPLVGTFKHAKEQLELYRGILDNRIVSKFDEAMAEGDIDAMAYCARAMEFLEGGKILIKRYLATRPLFTNPREVKCVEWAVKSKSALTTAHEFEDQLALALTALRALSAMYKDIVACVRSEAIVIDQVFPSPDMAMKELLTRIFEQPVQSALQSLLSVEDVASMSVSAIGAHLQLLTEAYTKTVSLAEELSEFSQEKVSFKGLADEVCGSLLDTYFDLEKRWLELLSADKTRTHRAGISVGLIDEVCSAYEEAAKRTVKLSLSESSAAFNIALMFFDKENNCLMEVIAKHILQGLSTAMRSCDKSSFGIEAVFQATSLASKGVGLVTTHYMSSVAPRIAPYAPQEVVRCEDALTNFTKNIERTVLAALHRSLQVFSAQLDVLLTSQQPSGEFLLQQQETVFELPTQACSNAIVSVEKICADVSNYLHGSNLKSYKEEVGKILHSIVSKHMLRAGPYSAIGGLKWRRDVSAYAECAAHVGAAAAVTLFEDLSGLAGLLVVLPEGLQGLVDGTLRVGHSKARRILGLREDYLTARVAGRSLAEIFDGE